jgi:signal transduction histidine kinase
MLKRRSRWMHEHRFIIVALLSLMIAVLPVIFIIYKLNDLEKNRIEDFKVQSLEFAELSKEFDQENDYKYLMNLMTQLSRTPAIEGSAFYIGNKRIIQAGKTRLLNTLRPASLSTSIADVEISRTKQYVNICVPLDRENRTMMQYIYSLRDFQNKRNTTLLLLVTVLALLITLTYLLGIYRRLHKAEETLNRQKENKSKMIKAIGHDALHYVSTLDKSIESMQSKNPSKVTIALSDTTKALSTMLENLKYNEESGEVDYNPMALSWPEVLHTIAKRTEALLIQKGVQLQLPGPEGHYVVWADRDLIERVLFNLVHNAFKYTRKNSRIEISVQQKNACVYTYIRDQGPGIPDEMKEHIFTPYTRLNDATYLRPEDRRGTGLGLSISREFISIHKGILEVLESTPGKGTTFSFSLPLFEAQKNREASDEKYFNH